MRSRPFIKQNPVTAILFSAFLLSILITGISGCSLGSDRKDVLKFLDDFKIHISNQDTAGIKKYFSDDGVYILSYRTLIGPKKQLPKCSFINPGSEYFFQDNRFIRARGRKNYKVFFDLDRIAKGVSYNENPEIYSAQKSGKSAKVYLNSILESQGSNELTKQDLTGFYNGLGSILDINNTEGFRLFDLGDGFYLYTDFYYHKYQGYNTDYGGQGVVFRKEKKGFRICMLINGGLGENIGQIPKVNSFESSNHIGADSDQIIEFLQNVKSATSAGASKSQMYNLIPETGFIGVLKMFDNRRLPVVLRVIPDSIWQKDPWDIDPESEDDRVVYFDKDDLKTVSSYEINRLAANIESNNIEAKDLQLVQTNKKLPLDMVYGSKREIYNTTKNMAGLLPSLVDKQDHGAGTVYVFEENIYAYTDAPLKDDPNYASKWLIFKVIDKRLRMIGFYEFVP